MRATTLTAITESDNDSDSNYTRVGPKSRNPMPFFFKRLCVVCFFACLCACLLEWNYNNNGDNGME